jgi:hypothetical protein
LGADAGGSGGPTGGDAGAASTGGASGDGGSGGASGRSTQGGASGSAGIASDWDGGSLADSGSTPDPPDPTCGDGLQNQDETGVDCGGASCTPCPCSFGTPELLGAPNLSGNDILAASPSTDARTVYVWGRIQGGAGPIAVSTRPDRGNSFGFASALGAPVETSAEGTPYLSSDGLSLIFFSTRAGGAGDRDLYAATRADTDAAFNGVLNLGSVNSPERDDAPWLSPDELTLYFSSRRASVQGDLWRATRSAVGLPFDAPAAVTELNSSGNDTGITFTADALVAYFASDRTGGLGGMDLYRAARANTSEAFATPELVAGLNTLADDAAPQLTADGQELFFVSDRNGSDTQLFRVTPICP